MSHILYCREKLNSEYNMCVEFRNLNWFNNDTLPKVTEFLKQHKVSNI